MFPNKIRHGDNLANLFEKFNRVIDYLHEIRLVAGNGIRINRLPAGTTIESTATATATGGTPSAPPQGHPFDAEIINKGTEENPDYYVRIYNSALPDSPNAGVVVVYEYEYSVPVTDFKIPSNDWFYVVLDVTYTEYGPESYSVTLALYPYGSVPYPGYTTFRKFIANGKYPNVVSEVNDNISVYGRWV